MATIWVWNPTWTFTQGVIVGQASMIVLAFLFLKYVVFEDAGVAKEAARARAEARLKRSKRPPPPPPLHRAPSLLSTLNYDLPTHAPESADWLNVLLAQTLSAYRSLINQSTTGEGGARGLMEAMLNNKTTPEQEEAAAPGLMSLDFIEVDEVLVGDKFPVLSNARVRPTGEGEGVRIELDVDLSDHISLSLATRLLVNFPRPRFATLPIALSLSLSRFSGTLSLTLPPPAPGPTAHPSLHLSLHPDFTLELATRSLLGARAKLQDIPKVEQLLSARIRGWITDKVVWPGRVEVALPGVGRKQSAHAAGASGGGEEWTMVSPPASTTSTTHHAHSDDDETDDNAPALPSGRPGSLLFPEADHVPEPPSRMTDSGAASVDLDADGGPSVLLRPKLRNRTLSPGLNGGLAAVPFPSGNLHRGFGALSSGSPPLARPASPTESLPGYYRSDSYGPAARAAVKQAVEGVNATSGGALGGTFGGPDRDRADRGLNTRVNGTGPAGGSRRGLVGGGTGAGLAAAASLARSQQGTPSMRYRGFGRGWDET